MWVLGWALGPGCAGPPEQEPPGEALLLDEAEDVLQRGLDEAIAVRATEIRETYERAMALGDYACPGEYSGFWYDDCEADSGALFSGYGLADIYSLFGEDAGSSWQSYVEATLTRPNGDRLQMGGYYGIEAGSAEGFDYVYDYVYGTFQDDREGELAQPVIASLALGFETAPDGARAVSAEGSLGAVGGDPTRAIDLWLRVSEPGYPDPVCAGAPSGGASVRMGDGTWAEIDFGEACDGCGVVTAGGLEVGTLCPDLGKWFDREVSP